MMPSIWFSFILKIKYIYIFFLSFSFYFVLNPKITNWWSKILCAQMEKRKREIIEDSLKLELIVIFSGWKHFQWCFLIEFYVNWYYLINLLLATKSLAGFISISFYFYLFWLFLMKFYLYLWCSEVCCYFLDSWLHI